MTERLAPVLRTTDASAAATLYLYVDDVDVAAAACGVGAVEQQDWGREFEVVDPDGNRLRVGTVHS